MSEISLRDAFECLDLPPEAGLAKVRRAYLELQGLYADGALASYGLLDAEGRRSRLERIETAYRLLLRKLTEGAGAVVPLHPVPEHGAGAGAPQTAAGGVEESPGSSLRRARERAGISLQEIARHTKLGTAQLASIEAERFDQLPAAVYLRGFVEQYAALVGLPEPRKIAAFYLARCSGAQENG
jgi:Helix-turn-helix domain